MDVHFGGTVKSGKDHKDTWKRMLTCYRDVSDDRADAILGVYPTFSSLWSMYQECVNEEQGRHLLSEIQVIF